MATERKTRVLRAILLLIAVCLISFPAHAKYSGGTGEPHDPYQIATAEDLMLLGENPEDYDKNFILTADINLDPNSPNRKVFESAVIAPDKNEPELWFQVTSFNGVFDGNGFTISNLNCKSEEAEYAGLFGRVRYGTIKDLKLVNAKIDAERGDNVGSLVGLFSFGTISGCSVQDTTVKGGTIVGGLVGHNGGTITNCYSSCIVDGNSAGGFAGSNIGGRISMCYSTGTVTGDGPVGGLVGQNGAWFRGHGERISMGGYIDHCYSTCSVTGATAVGGLVGLYDAGDITQCYSGGGVIGSERVGGLVGEANDGITYSFWDMEASGLAVSAGGIGKTTTEMKDPNTFLQIGWNFIGKSDGPHDIWAEPLEGGGYPVLWWQLPSGFGLPIFSDGNGEPNNPYLISTAEELNSIGHNPRLMAASFKLIEDIDMMCVNFFIISNKYFPFIGVFDGNNHTILNLTITGTDHVGLFGRLESKAEVKNLGVVDVNITGLGEYIGGLVGRNSGAVSHCYSTGTVSGDRYVGGLVGHNYEGQMSQCYSTGIVSGDWYVGGLTGVNYEAYLNQCFSNSAVNGDWDVGGLVGANTGTGEIVNCYASGAITGSHYVGGLVGRNGDFLIPPFIDENQGKIDRCYSIGRITGSSYVGGLVGSNYGIVEFSFWDIETSGLASMCGFQPDYGTGCEDSSGKITVEMQTGNTFLDAGWDFVDETVNGTEDIWWILEGRDYPRLWWEASN